MPTSTLTWSENHGDSALQSTFAATNQGAIQLLNNYLTALAAFSDFPWQVASFAGTTAPWQVTLKRKNGDPGRIIFVAVTTAPGATYNPQLGPYSWGAVGVRAAYFPLATSDTPANILATSGDVFTDPGDATGMSHTMAMVTGTNTLTIWGCEAGIFFRYGPPASFSFQGFVGEFLEDSAGGSASVSFAAASNIDTLPATSSPSSTVAGGYAKIAGAALQFGSGWVPDTALAAYLRDAGAKKSWFYPRSLMSMQLPPAKLLSYKLRQLAFGPTPLAGYERLASTGDVLEAQSTHPGIAATAVWLTNFKV
jgi:hypothetical protein